MGSDLSPLEMMMPSGSDDSISLRSFFINSLTLYLTRHGAHALKAADVPSRTQQHNLLLIKRLEIRRCAAGTRVSQNDTPSEDTSVFKTRRQLAIFLARKLLEELESSSTEIDQPLYWRRSSDTDSPRWPR